MHLRLTLRSSREESTRKEEKDRPGQVLNDGALCYQSVWERLQWHGQGAPQESDEVAAEERKMSRLNGS